MNIDKVCRQIARDLDEDSELVKDIVMHQFYFTTQVMKDDDDTRDVLINKLFRFKLKSRFKENKQSNYSPHEKVN